MKTSVREITISGKVKAGGGRPPLLIAGPCVIESEKHCLLVGRKIKDIAAAHGSLTCSRPATQGEQAFRTSFRGPGIRPA
jgi:2-dehydro-3-deoxyphosphooctonate aldolase (KDO 8-P synthase)